MAIFGALSFAPLAIVAKKVSESALHGIERMFQERQIPEGRIWGDQVWNGEVNFPKLFLTPLLQQHGENECAGVVIGSVSLTVLRDCEDRVLQYCRVAADMAAHRSVVNVAIPHRRGR